MATSRDDLIQLMEEAERRGDMDTAKAALLKLESTANQPPAPQPPPVQQSQYYGEPVVEDGQYQVGNPVSQGEQQFFNAIEEPIAAGVEGAMAMGSGMAADTYGSYAGAAGQAMDPTNPTAGYQTKNDVQDRFTYQPRTKAGRKLMEAIGGAAQYIGNEVGGWQIPFTDTRLGDLGEGERALTNASPTGEARTNERGQYVIGGEMGGQGQARLLEMTGPALEGAMGAGGLAGSRYLEGRGPQPGKVNVDPTGRVEPTLGEMGQVRDNLVNGRPEANTAGYRLTQDGTKVVKDPIGLAAIKQEFDPAFVAMVKTMTPKEKQNLRRMVKIIQSKKTNMDVDAMAGDVVGGSIMERVNRLQTVRDSNIPKITAAANELQGQQINVRDQVNRFRQAIAEQGGKFDDTGQLEWDIDSQLYKATSFKADMQAIYDKIENLGDNPDAFKVHRLKQFIDDRVTYGKSTGKPLSGIAEGLAKNLRRDLNEALKGKSSKYDEANTAYSDARGELDKLQKAIGKKINLEERLAETGAGQIARRLTGNAVSRIDIQKALEDVEAMATKYGGKYTDRIKPQMRALNEMERKFGPSNETSFKAEIDQAVQRGVESMSLRQGGMELGKGAFNKLRGKNEEAAFKALLILLNEKY